MNGCKAQILVDILVSSLLSCGLAALSFDLHTTSCRCLLIVKRKSLDCLIKCIMVICHCMHTKEY